ncbi:MAG TPA: acylphosphatase [Planctomycetota bacterium]|nr:acylphosphatase [Planctomycetota bacterium]
MAHRPSPHPVIRCRIQLRGRVQGVGFRRFAADCAVARGISGFVRNLPDGSVLCEAEGPAVAVQALLLELRQGPAFAAVTELVCTELPPAGDAGFALQ